MSYEVDADGASVRQTYAAILGHAGSLAPGYLRLRMRCPEIARVVAAGQFLMVTGCLESGRAIAMPVCGADPVSGDVDVACSDTAPDGHSLTIGRVGSRLEVEGPLGTPWDVEGALGHVLIVGEGIGIAPLVPLYVGLRDAGVICDVVQCADSADQVLFDDELEPIHDDDLIVYVWAEQDDDIADIAGGTTAITVRELLEENTYDRAYLAVSAQTAMAVGQMCAEVGLEKQFFG